MYPLKTTLEKNDKENETFWLSVKYCYFWILHTWSLFHEGWGSAKNISKIFARSPRITMSCEFFFFLTLVAGLLHGAMFLFMQSYSCSLRVFYMTLVVGSWKGHLYIIVIIIPLLFMITFLYKKIALWKR